jgi:HEAT repeat protein
MLEDPDTGVRRAALEAVAALGGERGVESLAARLADPDAGIRARAAALLAELGDLEEILAGSSALKAMLGSSDPEIRGMAVGALGRMRRGAVWRVIRTLMGDSDAAVRRAAIEASRTHPEPEILEALFGALDDSEVSGAAEEVLVGFGTQLVELVGVRQGGRKEVPIRLPALLARVGSPEALPLLLELAEGAQGGLREEALSATIVLCRGRAPEPGLLAGLGRLARIEAGTAQQFRRHLILVQGVAGLEALEFACREEMMLRFRNLAHLASALTPAFEPGPICQAAENGNAEEKAAAAEVVDNVLSGDLRRLLVPLLEKDPQRPAGADPMAEVVSILVSPPSDWILSAALFSTALTGRKELAPLVAQKCEHPNPIVRETALFALRDLDDGERLAEAARRLAEDPESVVRTLARSLLAAPSPGEPR